MFLKSIVINGFKSFALRRELIIHEGITGIVGPNGSGKSNIADAMRWVLGEQSSRNLRGSSMQEVIFKGTQTRPPKASCEVSLLFDNSDHHFDVPYSEVIVKRRLYRSGESEYSINGTSCRLRDIIALFRDTGLGKDGYSIIGQGRISRILDSRASERRLVFDEAAGIMKYRSRKDEAERNLARTQENLTRLGDIIAELKAQAEPLSAQVKAAGRYRELSEELRRTEVSLLLQTADQQRERKERLGRQKAEREEELAQAAAAREEAAKKRLEAREAVKSHTAVLQELEEKQQKMQFSLQRSRSDAALYAQRQEDLAQAVGDTHERLTRLSERLTSEETHLKTLGPELESLLALKQTQKEALRQVRDAQRPAADLSTRLEEKKSRIARLREVIRSRSEAAMQDQRSLGMALTQMEQLTSEGQALEARKKQLEKAGQENLERRGKAVREVRRTQEILRNLEKERQDIREKTEDTRAAVQNLEKQLSGNEARLTMVGDLMASHEGYYESVRALFRHLPAGEQGVYGTVADVIRVAARYEEAVETALGNAKQDVITADDATARRLIEILRRGQFGRVTFLPVDSLRIRRLSSAERETVKSMSLLGTADEFIRCEAKVRPAAEYLLGRTVLAETLDDALRVKNSGRNSFRIVTLAGDIVVPGGAITGGSAKRPEVSLLARKRMREELAHHRKELEERLNEARKRQEMLKDQASRIRADIENQGSALQQARLLLAQEDSEGGRLKAAQDELEKQQQIWAEDCRRAQQVADENEDTARSGHAELARLEEELADAEKEMRSLEAAADDMRADNERQRENAARLEKDLAALEAQIGTRQAARRHAEDAREEIEAETVQVKVRLEEQQAALRSAAAGAEKETRAIRELESAAEDLGTEIEKQRRRVRREEENQDFYQQQMEDTGTEETEKNRELYRLDAEMEKCTSAIDTAMERLWNEHELTWANAQPLRIEPFSAKGAQDRAVRLRAEIAALGPVNLNALSDWERLQERLRELTEQLEDLQAAAADLQIVISELMSAMKKEFEEKFAQINEAFSRTFSELFGGGSARLVLEEGVPAMEAGVEIRAEPPGKKLQNITLLSDGEKAMTAIALCFAMLEVNPSPICLLDEIDAPLDDRNVVRLAEYLSRLKEKLQFLVITHKKTTMSVCDTLYGIAMHEKGVTDLVSVAMD